MPRRRRTTTGAFTIGGVERAFPSIGVALSLAQNLAARADEPRQWGVYEDGRQIARVERDEDGVILTQPVAR